MPAPLHPAHLPIDCGQPRQRRDKRAGEPDALDQRERSCIRPFHPAHRVRGRQQRSCDKGGEGHQHAGIAAAHRRQRARAAAATKLHADAEQERAKAKCDTDRIDETRQRLPENSAQREQGKGDDTCRHEHDDLRPDAAAAPLDQHVPPRGREAEG